MADTAILDPPAQDAPEAALTLAGHHAAGAPPPVDAPGIAWSTDPAALFAPGIGAFVIADPGALPATVFPLLAARPTLFLVRTAGDVAALTRLVRARTVIATPADGVWCADGCAFGDVGLSALHAARVATPAAWIGLGGAARVPPGLSPFGALSKAGHTEIARRTAALALPRTQQFWRPLGAAAPLATLLMRTESMVRVDLSPHFAGLTPTLVLLAADDAEALGALALRQSTVVVAPFALPAGVPVDHALGALATARAEPFALHEVVHFGDVDGVSLGCAYGEFIR
ncbi:hypothetical protein [Acuticoccus kandeliae]|uniref:hypothetical protein n=1 Tax=Acuticoccus kandeliae TaxID=2073160 RepID=UPI00130084B8|nr:hypothetical protein [Acuticoccus kandeliae]